MMKKILKYCQNYQNVTQKPEVSKCCWKDGPSRPVLCRVATSLQSFRNAVSAKWIKQCTISEVCQYTKSK